MKKEEITILSAPDVVDAMQKKLEDQGVKLSKTVVKQTLDAYKSTVVDAITNGDEVHLQGFMNITLAYRKERQGFNIATKAPITIPEGVSVSIRPSSALKNLTRNYSKNLIKLVKDSE